MLVVLIAVAVLLTLVIERLFRHLAENYELEWDDDGAAAAAQARFSSVKDSERQMNGAFKDA